MYRADAQIRSDHVLRNPIVDIGKNIGDAVVPLFGGAGIHVFNAVILINEVKLGYESA